MASEGAASSTSRRGKDADKSTRSPSSPRSTQLPLAAPPRPGFPFTSPPPLPSIEGFWPKSGGSNGTGPSPQGNQAANLWGFPQGGFVNFINQNQFPVPPPSTGENFHLVGLTQGFSPFCPPPPTPYPKRTPPPPPPAGNIVSLNTEADVVVEESRTAKKSRTLRHWTHDEEERLASAWLNTSKDPIYGNDKSRDTFWGQISNEFNRNIQEHLKRDINQLKVHWTRLNKMISEFNGFWSSVTKVNKSGYSDDMLLEEAQKMYKKNMANILHWNIGGRS